MSYIPNPFVEQRKQYKLKLLDLIKRNPNIDKEQLIALFSLQTGLKRDTIKEYLSELEEAGILEQDVGVHTEGNNEGEQQKDKPGNE